MDNLDLVDFFILVILLFSLELLFVDLASCIPFPEDLKLFISDCKYIRKGS